MHHITIHEPDSFTEFRDAARSLIAANASPDSVVWSAGGEGDLFGEALAGAASSRFSVPAAFVSLAEDVVCHRDGERFALLYQALWHIVQGERSLLNLAADPLVHHLMAMQKAVRRDIHKMTAFVRFRQVVEGGEEYFIAWFEPEHHILRRVAPFFIDRFAQMHWSILTPLGSLQWDGVALSIGPAVSRDQAPQDDALEDWWRTYYRATFNPARANPKMQRTEMPKRYWHNLPEAPLIPEMLAEARERTRRMVEAPPTAPRQVNFWKPQEEEPVAGDPADTAIALASLKAAAQTCERCPLYRNATQTVFGEGPVDASVVFVGEQPGDQEDLAGRPFVGPAGQLFDRALADANIARERVYVTNAVKHFKFEPRGKRRIHKTPDRGEVEHCRWWLDQELAVIKPRLTVALGATAARALTGRNVTISRERGRLSQFVNGQAGLITVHPSFLLRLPDEMARAAAYTEFVADLRLVAEHLPPLHAAA